MLGAIARIVGSRIAGLAAGAAGEAMPAVIPKFVASSADDAAINAFRQSYQFGQKAATVGGNVYNNRFGNFALNALPEFGINMAFGMDPMSAATGAVLAEGGGRIGGRIGKAAFGDVGERVGMFAGNMGGFMAQNAMMNPYPQPDYPDQQRQVYEQGRNQYSQYQQPTNQYGYTQPQQGVSYSSAGLNQQTLQKELERQQRNAQLNQIYANALQQYQGGQNYL